MEFATFTFKYLLAVSVSVLVSVCAPARAGPAPGPGLLAGMPPGCAASHYCTEKHAAYPQQRVDDLLTQHHVSLGNRFMAEFAERQGNEADQDDCKKYTSYSPIYEIKDADGNVRVVVQTANFTQQIRIEYCESPGRLQYPENTSHFTVEQMQAHVIECRDYSMAYSFLVLSADGRALEAVRAAAIPVSCACRLIEA